MRSRWLLILALACFWPASSSALSMTIGMVGGDVMTPTSAALGCGTPAPDGSFTCSGSGMTSMPNGDWTLSMWNIYLDPDPIVSAFTAIRNMTPNTQTFFLNIVLPLTNVVGPPVTISGSIQGGVSDSNGSATALLTSVAPTAIYRAAIDGVVVKTLLNHLSSLNVNTLAGSNSFFPVPGYTNVLLPGTTAAANIAIFLRFNLSPGDSASFTSVFNVVPEPSTAALVGFGLLGFLAAVRRGRAAR